MSSHLTRLVFRQLICGRTIVHRGCIYHGRFVERHNAALNPQIGQRRAFWNMLRSPPAERQPKAHHVFPGEQPMRDLTRSEMLDSRPPLPAELQQAFRTFFAEKEKKTASLTETVANHVSRTIAYLNKHQPEDGVWLDVGDWKLAMKVLGRSKGDAATEAHQRLALLILERINDALAPTDQEPIQPDAEAVRLAVEALCRVRKSVEALAFLNDKFDSGATPAEGAAELYQEVLRGLRNQDASETELEKVLKSMKDRHIEATKHSRSVMTQYYARLDNTKKAVEWLERPITQKDRKFGEVKPTSDDIIAIIQSCMRVKEEQVGRRLLEKYLDQHLSSQRLWTYVFQFAASMGRGVDEVERMMQVLDKRKPADANWSIDISMINSLVKLAIDKQDPYLAERFIAMGEKRGIQPDAMTAIYQMNYRLSIDDVDGALAAYERARDFPFNEDESERKTSQEIDAINHLIQAMCGIEKRYSFESIMRIVDDLADKPKTRFHPSTVSCLCILHLRREEYHDVIDLLRTHALNFNVAERVVIRDVLVDYCFDMRNSIAKVWDAYQIFRQIFDAETPREVRTRIMNEFYKRRRADMAFHVFEHMRHHADPRVRATGDTYVDALVGIGRLADEETLEFVHNQLKLDAHVEPDTRLNNALMLAYVGIDQPRRALEFWDDVITSTEGPSYNSILIVLRACEVKPFGVEEAKAIWDRLVQLDIEVSKEVFTAWVACLGGNAYTNDARDFLHRAGEFGVDVDDHVLGSLYNATTHPHKQRELAVWMQEDYPEIFKELRARGSRRTRTGALRINGIDRSLNP